MFSILLLMTVALANTEITCGVAQSYEPPKNDKQPHKVVLEKVDLVFWPEDLANMEIVPWALVSRNVCIEGRAKVKRPFKPTITVRRYSQIRLVEKGK